MIHGRYTKRSLRFFVWNNIFAPKPLLSLLNTNLNLYETKRINVNIRHLKNPTSKKDNGTTKENG